MSECRNAGMSECGIEDWTCLPAGREWRFLNFEPACLQAGLEQAFLQAGFHSFFWRSKKSKEEIISQMSIY